MTPIEKIVLILIAFSLVKMIVLAIKPGVWYDSTNPLVKLWSNKTAGTVISFALIVIVLFYLLQELSITQVFAAMVFGMLFILLSLEPYVKKIFKMVQEDIAHRLGIVDNKHFLRRNWLSFSAWIILIFWVVWDIFIK